MQEAEPASSDPLPLTPIPDEHLDLNHEPPPRKSRPAWPISSSTMLEKNNLSSSDLSVSPSQKDVDMPITPIKQADPVVPTEPPPPPPKKLVGEIPPIAVAVYRKRRLWPIPLVMVLAAGVFTLIWPYVSRYIGR